MVIRAPAQFPTSASPIGWQPNGGFIPQKKDVLTMQELRALQAGQQQSAPPIWQPGYMSTPQTPYPANPYAPVANTTGGRSGGGGGGYGGGGGSGYSGPVIAVEPSTSLGAGAYWPGHSQEFAKQIQQAILGGPNAMAGMLDQPAVRAAMNAWNARNNPNPNARRMAGGNGSPFGINGGGGGGGGRLAGGYQAAHDAAQQANEARYGDIMSGYQARRNANLGAGAQAARDINMAWDKDDAARRQALIGRGLGNSSTLQASLAGNQERRQDNLGRLNEQLRREESGLLADQLGFMERRTDEGPDMNQAIALAQGLGQAGAGQPRVIGTQVVPTMGGVGFTGGGGYTMPVQAAGGGFAGRAMGGMGGIDRADMMRQQVAMRVNAIKRLMNERGWTENQARGFFNTWGNPYG